MASSKRQAGDTGTSAEGTEAPAVGTTAAEPAEVETIRAELAKFRERDAKAAKARADADTAEAIKRGEAERLYTAERTAREAAEARLAEHDAREAKRAKALDERTKAKIAEIPEARRSLVPKALKGEDLAEYLEANWHLLTQGEDRPAGTRRPAASASASDSDKGIPDAIKAEALRHGQDAAKWWALVKKTDPKRAKALTGAN